MDTFLLKSPTNFESADVARIQDEVSQWPYVVRIRLEVPNRNQRFLLTRDMLAEIPRVAKTLHREGLACKWLCRARSMGANPSLQRCYEASGTDYYFDILAQHPSESIKSINAEIRRLCTVMELEWQGFCSVSILRNSELQTSSTLSGFLESDSSTDALLARNRVAPELQLLTSNPLDAEAKDIPSCVFPAMRRFFPVIYELQDVPVTEKRKDG